MATRHEPTRSPFGIAHLTVVPENFDPGWVHRGDEEREGESWADAKGTAERQANRERAVGERTSGERDG